MPSFQSGELLPKHEVFKEQLATTAEKAKK
jgi:hypothetical protein